MAVIPVRPRTRHIDVRLSTEAHEVVARAASGRGVRIAAYMREAALERARGTTPEIAAHDERLLAEIRRLVAEAMLQCLASGRETRGAV